MGSLNFGESPDMKIRRRILRPVGRLREGVSLVKASRNGRHRAEIANSIGSKTVEPGAGFVARPIMVASGTLLVLLGVVAFVS